MPNNYFQFKQFTVQQDKCAMKVCTDACLFGAYIANHLQHHLSNDILDIGSGTGLLPLMLAQKTTGLTDTVEIDEAAFNQAKENITRSPWKDKISIFNTDILKFVPAKKYDCIISNPPFFEDDLRSADIKKNAAKHDASLTLVELLNSIERLLTTNGIFAVLLPFHRSNYFEAAAAQLNFHLSKKILIKQTPKHNYFRAVLIFSRQEANTLQEEIIIKNEDGNYAPLFINLLKDYYLHL